jgi:hypothetical protein
VWDSIAAAVAGKCLTEEGLSERRGTLDLRAPAFEGEGLRASGDQAQRDDDVPEPAYLGILKAVSAGHYFNDRIQDSYRFVRPVETLRNSPTFCPKPDRAREVSTRLKTSSSRVPATAPPQLPDWAKLASD